MRVAFSARAASVHLGYVAGDFHTLLDGELFLPEETWDQDRARCRAAGIPDDVVYDECGERRAALFVAEQATGVGLFDENGMTIWSAP